MNIQRIAAFSNGNEGGNPAGVVVADELPDGARMQAIAAEIGFSETAFATPKGDGWAVRYFSPESEVPFCGHATIALGAALAMEHGDGVFPLSLNASEITVEGRKEKNGVAAALQSPPTRSKAADPDMLEEALLLFGYARDDLDTRIPPAFAEGGATHLVIALKERSKLAAMNYDLTAGREFMNRHGLVTVALVFARADSLFDVRNPFASGGVFEDPATGAAAAAFSGYLRDIGWPHGGSINIVQGEDMGMKSLLRTEIPDEKGSSIRVSGHARVM